VQKASIALASSKAGGIGSSEEEENIEISRKLSAAASEKAAA